MISINIPLWLAKNEKLTTSLTGEVLKETDRAIYIKGYAKILPSQNCLRCGRIITNPVSQVVGIGPECCKALGIVRPDYVNAIVLQKQLEEITAFEKWFPKSQVQIEGTYEIIAPIITANEIIGNRLCIADNNIRVYTSIGYKELCKSVSGYKWNTENKSWDYPIRIGIAKQLIEIFAQAKVQLTVAKEVDELMNEVVVLSRGATDKLFPYQLEGVRFLVQYKRALLADDMGLGKTVQAIMAAIEIGKKILVVCPASLKRNWQREFNHWAPEWETQIIEGTPKQRQEQMASSSAKVFICSWELLRLGAKVDKKTLSTIGPELTTLGKMKFDVCIMDEAHKIKNRKALVTMCAAYLAKCIPYVFPLTGTPMMNNPDDLYSILNVLSPREFKSYWKFVERWCVVSSDGYGYTVGGLKPNASGALKAMLGQLVLRRTKGEVLKDLPEKRVQKFYCTLEGKQAKIYNEMSEEMYTQWEGEVISATVVIAQITRLRQILIDPTLMMKEYCASPLEGAKIDALLTIFDGLGEEKMVVFSQFSQACKRLKITLEKAGYKGTILTGDMNSKNRDIAVQKFQEDPTCKFIIVSTLAGGTGLTLTAASTAIFLDKYWTPAINLQAQDRLHRIGQKKSVTIIELLGENTVEDSIEELLRYKYEQFQSLFETDNIETTSTKIKSADLVALLGRKV